ncbi:hypothetical protein U9M48_015068 [Paspalum notatum var. saurae]|uniref:Auxin-responsive protein SAUR36 n=1 Tax=Paspalum notatum var. saurae TaxID=547442 RepID=A0AAQ3T5T9_PASNO
MIISAKRLVQMAKKWQRMAALARKRLMSTPAKETEAPCGASTSSVASKGHCVVYSADGGRFEVPLVHLGTAVFGELLDMSQEEFGFASDDGRITLPCDAAVVEYVMCLLRRGASEEVVRALLSSMARPCRVARGVAPLVELKQQLLTVNAASTSTEDPLLSRHMTYSISVASQGSVIRPLPTKAKLLLGHPQEL